MRNQTAQILKIRNYTDNKSKIIKSLLKSYAYPVYLPVVVINKPGNLDTYF